ncbi:MAG: hypothetical protein HZA50_00525 [Planctomycetes bacterium]|nr:hypothetical protein [Planctomycetota bacterium]
MKIIALCGLAVLLSAGCNPELDQYNQIELGKALANRGMLTATTAPAEDGKFYICYDMFIFPLPLISAQKKMGILTDNAGNVIAKYYLNYALEHWILMQLGFSDIRLEVQIPPEYFHETPPGWENKDSPNQNALTVLKIFFRRMPEGLPDDKQGIISVENKDTIDEYVWVIKAAIHPKRIKAGVLDRLTDKNPDIRIDIHKDIDLEGFDAARFGVFSTDFWLVRDGSAVFLRAEARQRRDNHYMVCYLTDMFNKFNDSTWTLDPQKLQQLEKFYRLCPSTDLPFLMGMCFGGLMMPSSVWPVLCPDYFGGMTKDGFERTVDFGCGGIAVLRNLGGRKIQITYHYCRITDPFFIAAIANLIASTQPAPIVKTTINKIGE